MKAAHGTLTPQNSIVSVSAMHEVATGDTAADVAVDATAEEAAATAGTAAEDEAECFSEVESNAAAEADDDDDETDDDAAGEMTVDSVASLADCATCFLGAGRANRPANEAADGAEADCVCTLFKC